LAVQSKEPKSKISITFCNFLQFEDLDFPVGSKYII